MTDSDGYPEFIPLIAGVSYSQSDRLGRRMSISVEGNERVRTTQLIAAEDRARELFKVVTDRRSLKEGVSGCEASDNIQDVAAEEFGVNRWWHKRIVRAGPNTLFPYRDNPPDRLLTDDDIPFLDFRSLFEEWPASPITTFATTALTGSRPSRRGRPNPPVPGTERRTLNSPPSQSPSPGGAAPGTASAARNRRATTEANRG